MMDPLLKIVHKVPKTPQNGGKWTLSDGIRVCRGYRWFHNLESTHWGTFKKKFRKSRSIRVPIFFARVDLISSLPFLMTSDYEQDHPFVPVEPPVLPQQFLLRAGQIHPIGDPYQFLSTADPYFSIGDPKCDQK